MSFPEANAAVEEKWVVVVSRLVGDGEAGGVGELVAGTYNEIVKGVFGDQVRLFGKIVLFQAVS
jgi:hypothetical protein